MKLNKNGWGFLEFFFFLIVFVVCLIVAFSGLKKLGLMDSNNQFINNNGSNTNNSTNKNNNNSNKEDKPLVSYPSLEEKMVEATKKYITEYYGDQLGLDTLNIRVSQLKSSGHLKKLEDSKGRECSGYVSVYLDVDNKIIYKPFLKCKSYETNGYEERKDD